MHDAAETTRRRELLKKYGLDTPQWRKRVNLMPQDQVDAIYLRWLGAGRFNRKK